MRLSQPSKRPSECSTSSSISGSVSFSLMVMQESLKDVALMGEETASLSAPSSSNVSKSNKHGTSSMNNSKSSLTSESWEQGTASTSSLTAPLSPMSSPCIMADANATLGKPSKRKGPKQPQNASTSNATTATKSTNSNSSSTSTASATSQTVTSNDRIEFKDGRVFIGHHVRGEMRHGTMIYTDGTVFRGKWKHGKRHGPGHCTFPDGSVYDGDFDHGLMHGNGSLTWSDGVQYVGNWVEGAIHGRGKEIDADGVTVRHDGFWEQGSPVRQSDGKHQINVSNR